MDISKILNDASQHSTDIVFPPTPKHFRESLNSYWCRRCFGKYDDPVYLYHHCLDCFAIPESAWDAPAESQEQMVTRSKTDVQHNTSPSIAQGTQWCSPCQKCVVDTVQHSNNIHKDVVVARFKSGTRKIVRDASTGLFHCACNRRILSAANMGKHASNCDEVPDSFPTVCFGCGSTYKANIGAHAVTPGACESFSSPAAFQVTAPTLFEPTAPGQSGSPRQSATGRQTAPQSTAKPIIGHKCFECETWFDSSESVKTHKRIVHVHTVEANLKRGKLVFHRSDSGFFECHCGARAADSKRFVSHSCHCSLVFVPHDLMCTTCGSTFVNMSDLNQHAGAKFSCNPCPIPAPY
jgi:hypothetical protein